MKTNIEKNFPVIVATMANAIYQGPPGPEVDLTNYYTKSEVDAKIPDIPGLATEDYVLESIAGIPEPDLSGYARIEDIPSTAGLATEQYVDNAIANINIPEVDLTNYYTKSEVDGLIETIELTPGPQGEPGQDYILTEADKSEIAGMVVVDTSTFATMAQVEAKGYQTEANVNALINTALGVIENGTY